MEKEGQQRRVGQPSLYTLKTLETKVDRNTGDKNDETRYLEGRN